MTARELIIACFGDKDKHVDDQPGLELMLTHWLKIHRPVVFIYEKDYTIRCADALDAEKVVLNLGGTVEDDCLIRGTMRDLVLA